MSRRLVGRNILACLCAAAGGALLAPLALATFALGWAWVATATALGR